MFVQGLVVERSRDAVTAEGESPSELRRVLVHLPIAAFLVVGAIAANHTLVGATDVPYRLLGSLREENEKVDLGTFGTLRVNPETARYVREVAALGGGRTRECSRLRGRPRRRNAVLGHRTRDGDGQRPVDPGCLSRVGSLRRLRAQRRGHASTTDSFWSKPQVVLDRSLGQHGSIRRARPSSARSVSRLPGRGACDLARSGERLGSGLMTDQRPNHRAILKPNSSIRLRRITVTRNTFDRPGERGRHSAMT